jgi:hypothetical protein
MFARLTCALIDWQTKSPSFKSVVKLLGMRLRDLGAKIASSPVHSPAEKALLLHTVLAAEAATMNNTSTMHDSRRQQVSLESAGAETLSSPAPTPVPRPVSPSPTSLASPPISHHDRRPQDPPRSVKIRQSLCSQDFLLGTYTYLEDFDGRPAYSLPSKFGLTWKDVGADKPTSGIEVKNARLATALGSRVQTGHIAESSSQGAEGTEGRVEFTAEEWTSFQVHSLSSDSYVSVAGRYMRPVPSTEYFVFFYAPFSYWIVSNSLGSTDGFAYTSAPSTSMQKLTPCLEGSWFEYCPVPTQDSLTPSAQTSPPGNEGEDATVAAKPEVGGAWTRSPLKVEPVVLRVVGDAKGRGHAVANKEGGATLGGEGLDSAKLGAKGSEGQGVVSVDVDGQRLAGEVRGGRGIDVGQEGLGSVKKGFYRVKLPPHTRSGVLMQVEVPVLGASLTKTVLGFRVSGLGSGIVTGMLQAGTSCTHKF